MLKKIIIKSLKSIIKHGETMTAPKTQDKHKIAITLNLPIRDHERIIENYVNTGIKLFKCFPFFVYS
jgi:hypothetical protein